jgi:hypothetical protein
MNPGVAQQIACASHAGQRTRFGDSVVEHLGRVAGAVPPEVCALAWMHDLLELTPCQREELRAQGLTAVEESALGLLTRDRSESYEAYIRRIALAPGRAGELARTVKLADLADHLGHVRTPPRAPPYSWARRVLEQPGVESFPVLAG